MGAKKWRYGIILDAGSSGTRLHIYRWKDPRKVIKDADDADDLRRLPKLKTKKSWTKKIRPGVSTFGTHPEDIGPDHLQQLIDAAIDIIPANKVKDTPIFLMATAGMRLLPKAQQTAVLDQICSYFQQKTQFYIRDCDSHVQVIPGETEGLYGWLSTNYLLGGFDEPENNAHGKGHHTYGFLDMGGASAQIAFAPNATEAKKHSNDLKLVRLRKANGEPSEYRVFTATWLGFGVNQARERYVKSLEEEFGGSSNKELPDPCLPKGLRTTTAGELVDGEPTSGKPSLIGTGDFKECLRKTYPLLRKDAPCEDNPCLLNGLHVPAIDFDVNHFIGVSEYWHTTHGVFSDKGDRPYDFKTYQKKVKQFCNRRWDDIESSLENGKENDTKVAQEACFKASWLINVLHDGIGIPRIIDSNSHKVNVSKGALEEARKNGFLDPFRPVDKIHDVEVSWTLGRMLLYASGQVPPKNPSNPLPVGIGDNEGKPSDFLDLGSSYKPVDLGSDEDDEWDADDLLEKARDHKSTSGLVLLVLLLVVLAFIFRKRDRRMRFGSKVGSLFRRRRPASPRKMTHGFSLTNKLFGRNTPIYERIVEEGAAGQFELCEVDSDENDHSDSSEGSRFGRTSGLATPKVNVEFFDEPRAGSALDRSGLVVRTESRERLVPTVLTAGRRSRAGSPTRLKSPLMSPLSED